MTGMSFQYLRRGAAFPLPQCVRFALAASRALPPFSCAMAERPISTLNKPDVALELTLRPSLFCEFTGQEKVKERLEIAVAAARPRGEALDHILLNGPLDLGQTTPASIIAPAMCPNP